MKKKAEMLRKINEMRKTVIDLLSAGKVDEAKVKSEELEKLNAEYDKMPDDTAGGRVVNRMDKTALKRAVNNYLHRGYRGLDEADKKLVKPVNATAGVGQIEGELTRGGVFVPLELADFVEMMSTGVYRLRDRVSEYFASSLSGRIPLANNPKAGLLKLFAEMPEEKIATGDIKFGSIEWAVKNYGLIVPISKELMDDATVDVAGIVAEQFFRAQVLTENELILKAIMSKHTTPTAVSSWKDILKALNGTAPIGSPDKVIVTTTDGYNYLDTLTDEKGMPILTQALVDNPKRMFRGYEVIQLPNDAITVESGIPFVVGSLRDAVCFIERKGLEFDYNPYSDNAYNRMSVDVRIACRIDCQVKYSDAVEVLTLDVTP